MSLYNKRKFDKIEKTFEKLGYKRVEMYSLGEGIVNYIRFERTSVTCSFIHTLELIHKASGTNLCISSQKGLNSDGFNNAVGMSDKELLAAHKLMRVLGWKPPEYYILIYNLKKWWYSTYLKTKEMFNSIKQVNQIHLCDKVWYRGEIWFVNNAVRSTEDGTRLYSILPKRTLPDGSRKGLEQHVPRTEFRRVFDWDNIKNALFSHYDWWKRYWYTIHLRECMEGTYGKSGKHYKK